MTRGVLLAPALFSPLGGAAPHRGEELRALKVIRDAALAWEDGVISFVGPRDRLPPLPEGTQTFEATAAVIPGFVDCHTHLPFFGWRADEFEARLAGRTYRDLHTGGGGGIYRSARLMDSASDEEVLEFCMPLVEEMVAHGTTAVELKTGYGLSLDRELRQARLARRLAEKIPQTAVVTLLACHAIPEDRSREAWVEEVCRDLIPTAAAEGLVEAVDVYIEDIAFTAQDLAKVAEAVREHGLLLRSHADQLGASGAAEAAAALGVRSADHLNHVSAEGVRALGREPTAAVLLPVSTLFLGERPAPAADLLAAGAAVALATDFNPGTSPCLSVPEAISVASSLYRMPVPAAITAATLNAAWVLGLHERLGSLEPGKRADFLVLDAEEVSMIPYRPGHNPVVETWIAGERVFVAGAGTVRDSGEGRSWGVQPVGSSDIVA